MNVLFRIIKHVWCDDFTGSIYELQRYSRINKAWAVCLTNQRLSVIHSYMDDYNIAAGIELIECHDHK